MHQSIKFILFWNDTRHVRTVFLSIIRSSRLYIQQQAYVKQILLSAWTLDVQDWTCSNRHMSNRYCWLWPSGVQDCTYSNRHMSNRYCCLLDHQEFKTVHTATGICETDAVVCLLASRQQYLTKQSAVSVWQMPVAVCIVLNSWWWMERPSDTCRVSFQNKINLTRCWIELVLL